jgi:hypothetical protein
MTITQRAATTIIVVQLTVSIDGTETMMDTWLQAK